MKIQTSRGEIDERELRKVELMQDDVQVVEYYWRGELVHRSAEAKLTGLQATAELKDLTRP